MMKLEDRFGLYAKVLGIKLKREYRFHPTRKWRFDFADVERKIAIEIEGGIWSGGRHTRGKGFRNDTIKYNQAAVLGWKVLRYCSEEDFGEYFEKDYHGISDN